MEHCWPVMWATIYTIGEDCYLITQQTKVMQFTAHLDCQFIVPHSTTTKNQHLPFLPARQFQQVKKMLLFMRLTVILVLAACLKVSAAGYAQEITLKAKDMTCESVFREITRQSGYQFFFNKRLIRNARNVSVELNAVPVEKAIAICFADQPFDFAIVNKTVVIRKKEQRAAVLPDAIPIPPPPVDISLSGRVTNEKKEPMEGVSVTVKGTQAGTTTNADGRFQLSVPSTNVQLVFSFVGYATQTVRAGSQTVFYIVMQEAVADLSDVVVVGYGSQNKNMVTGSVATVRAKDLVKAPFTSTTNALTGRIPGLISVQSSGKPGADAAKLRIRGFSSPLIIVDGVETDFNSLDINQIESVSVLKDGSAAIYGSRAGNGVILVTTKRGLDEKPSISLNSSYTLQGITVMPRPVSSGQYAEMVSEDWLQNGNPQSTVPYTPEQIEKYYKGGDPLYPDTDWYNVLVRDWAPQQQHNLSVRGGTERIKYFGFLGYNNQQSMWKENGGDYKRYNLQSNIDASITNNLSLQLDLAATARDQNTTWRPQNEGNNTVWQDFWYTMPTYPAYLPDPDRISFAEGGGTGGAHVVTNRDIAGYNDENEEHYKGTFSLNYRFPWIKGLSAKGFVNILQIYGTAKNFSRPVNFYTYNPANDEYKIAGSLGSKASLTYYKNQQRTITGQLSLNYEKRFNDVHNLKVLMLYEGIDYSSNALSAGRTNFLTPSIEQLFGGSTIGMSNNGSSSEMGRESYITRINYDYDEKYLAEFIFRADASAKFRSDKRLGYFPGISVGWRIDRENFIKGTSFLDNLKLRASYAMSGNDAVGNFQYLSGYRYGNTYPFGNGVTQGLVSRGLANPNLTWEKITIANAGVDFSFLNRKLFGEIDIFYRELKGTPANRIGSLPSTFGAPLPPENLNSSTDRGVEMLLGSRGRFANNILWEVSGNISWSRSKWDHFEEPEYENETQREIYQRSGRWKDLAYGYLSDGLFTSQQEIDHLGFNQDANNNTTLKPGDIRYIDINGDGILDWQDQVVIGKGTVPNWMFGLDFSLSYKGFDISALFQGAFGYYKFIQLQQGGVYPRVMYDLRWTEQNNDPNAFVPRLGQSLTNGLYSDHYYQKADYLRLKVLNIGYNIPRSSLDNLHISQLRLFFAATNFFTLDKLRKFDTDPEAPNGSTGYYYPQQRTMTFGINITL